MNMESADGAEETEGVSGMQQTSQVGNAGSGDDSISQKIQMKSARVEELNSKIEGSTAKTQTLKSDSTARNAKLANHSKTFHTRMAKSVKTAKTNQKKIQADAKQLKTANSMVNMSMKLGDTTQKVGQGISTAAQITGKFVKSGEQTNTQASKTAKQYTKATGQALKRAKVTNIGRKR